MGWVFLQQILGANGYVLSPFKLAAGISYKSKTLRSISFFYKTLGFPNILVIDHCVKNDVITF